MSITQNIKRYFLPVLLALTVFIYLLNPTSDNLNSLALKIQARLNDGEMSFNDAIKGKALMEALAANEEGAPVIEKLEGQSLLLFYFRGDSLAHWTSNEVSLPNPPAVIDKGTSLIKLKNGWYQAMKYTDTLTGEAIVGLMAVKHEYPFENKFLKNDFALRLKIPNNIELSEQRIPGSIAVKNMEGKTLFSLYESAGQRGDDINLILLVAQCLFLLIVFYYIHLFSVNLLRGRGFIAGFAVLLASVVFIRVMMFWFDQPSEFYKLEIFHPKYYASSVVTKSLGDLIINCLLLMWIVLFTAYYRGSSGFRIRANALTEALGVLGVFLFTGAATWVFKTLVIDSVISFEVYNVLSLNLYSLLGIICIALLLISHFLFLRSLILYFRSNGVKWWRLILFSFVGGILFSAFAYGSQFYESILFSAVWTVAAILIFYLLLARDSMISVRNLILYISLYGILSTYLVENLYERKERNNRLFFAGKLVTERDYVAEYMFDDIAQRISTDPFIKNYFTNPLIPRNEIASRLGSIYLSGYFNKYELEVFTYDRQGNSIRNRDTMPLRNFQQLIRSDSIRQQTLQYISDTVQNYYYLSFFPFYQDTSLSGTLILKLVPKVYYGQNVYPELLLGGNISSSEDNNYTIYNYAIYQHERLVIQHGDFPYSYYWDKDFDFEGKQYRFIDIGDWEHIIYQYPNDKRVVVTIGQEGLFEPVATFSYMFSFYFIVVFAVLLLYRSLKSRGRNSGVFSWFILSFRTRINYSMLLMIVISFVIIGLVTISFFRKQYDNFYNDRLLHREKAVHASLEYFIQQRGNGVDGPPLSMESNALSLEISRLAEINDVDIDLYDKNGDLAVASQPAIYDKGILSKKMNPDAYFELVSSKGAQVTEAEKIGGLSYLAIYAPLRNATGEAISYLGIPYFARSKNVNDEVSSFLVALMNVYVFLLICAAILAYFISNSITRPLTIISEKLRILNLNKRNEPIEWKSKDEIGTLIGEYNKMIKELEQSAIKLAKSERESAWRERAKQIAHEIKNPLTPMKLSIQYLQRAIDSGDPNIDQLAKRVARTLEEQIENLSSIATAFSSFAKMPKAQNEIINLNELLKSIADLFNGEDKVTIAFTSDSESPLIFADKNQMVSVFNNLVKNAMQSIPENRKGFVDIHVEEETGWVKVSISDNGTGIPVQLQDKVFVPNFTTKSSGTGLGLAITKQMVDGAGGRIWFESAENVGTTFYVLLRKNESV